MNSSAQLMTLRTLTGAFIGGIVMITVALAFVAPEIILPEAWVLAVLLGLVAVTTVVSLVLIGSVPAAPQGATLSDLLAKVQPVHILRMALMEAPAIIAVVLMFLSEDPSWITVAITAVPTILLMLLFVFPHQGVLRRYERALDSGGARSQFTDKLLGNVV